MKTKWVIFLAAAAAAVALSGDGLGAPAPGPLTEVVVAAPSLSGLSLVEQHRRVYQALAEPLADGTIHELRIKTKGN